MLPFRIFSYTGTSAAKSANWQIPEEILYVDVIETPIASARLCRSYCYTACASLGKYDFGLDMLGLYKVNTEQQRSFRCIPSAVAALKKRIG